MQKIMKNLFLVVGILVVLIGVILTGTHIANKSKYVETTGTVTNCYEERDLRSGTDQRGSLYEWKLDIVYFVNGAEHNISLFHNKMDVGDEIKIMYNVDKPDYVTFKSSMFVAPVFILFGAIIICLDRHMVKKRNKTGVRE